MQVRFDMVACYVFRADETGRLGQVLQLRRSPNEFMGSSWSTVRGKMEAGETAYGAALRELREETGLTPAEFFQLDTIDIFYLHGDDTLWHCPGFVALIGREQNMVLNEEHDAVRWVDRQQIDRSFMWPGERQQLAEACREILDDGPAKPYLRIPLDKRTIA